MKFIFTRYLYLKYQKTVGKKFLASRKCYQYKIKYWKYKFFEGIKIENVKRQNMPKNKNIKSDLANISINCSRKNWK